MKIVFKLFQKKIFQINYLISLIFIFLSVITLLSLISIKNTHNSLFYFNSLNSEVSNGINLLKYNFAASLFYLFGINAYIFVLLFFYISKIFWHKLNFKKEWDIILGFIILLISSCILFSNFKLYLFNIKYGIVGDYLITFFGSNFKDKKIINLFIPTLLYISFILLNRMSLVSLLHPITNVLNKIEIKFLIKLKNCINNQIATINESFNEIFNFFSFKNNNANEFFLEAEYLDKLVCENIDLDDKFWNEYKQKQEKSINIIENNLNIITVSEKQSQEIKKEYIFPDIHQFTNKENSKENSQIKELEKQAQILEDKLRHFGLEGTVVSIAPGPVVTLFEYQPSVDTKISKIIALEDDLSMALQATSIRIIAPIPGKSVVGFEVANKNRKNVLFSTIIHSNEFKNFSGYLPLILGEDTLGNKIIVDLVKMPHLLVAGSTGSGKSVSLNAVISGLLFKCSPENLKLILIDPKRLEFSQYADIGHLLFPIVTNPKHAALVLRWVIQEMEMRYETMAQIGAKNIFEYNEYCQKNTNSMYEKKPFIVVIIDELADLMMTSGKEVEDLIIRIAQMARASGIHMIVATQRPSVDVITGLIKINFPSRISFRVASKIDSRIILDSAGADKLLGKGDMLFLDSQSPFLRRVHGAYITSEEIFKIVNHIHLQVKVEYLNLALNLNANSQEVLDEDDDLFKNIIEYLNEIDEVSISLLQRKFKIGYNRSARIIERLEQQGYICPIEGGKTRKVIKSS